MSDFPNQGLLQQHHARSISGQDLEVMGKKAAADWHSGKYETLNQSVVATVKQAQLAPEQVKRIVEFANTSAYLSEFNKEGSHRVIEFNGGPADPSNILKDLNDGGGGTVFDRGTLDYQSAPEKTASVDDGALEEAFHTSGVTSYANPYAPAMELRDKLAGDGDHLGAEISGLEVMYAELGDRVYGQVKQAALEGTSLGEVLQAWEAVAPSVDHIKVAFQLLTPRLLREGVFPSLEQMHRSLDKTAGEKVANAEHPVIQEFAEFCNTLTTLAEKRAERKTVLEGFQQLTEFLKKEAAGGAWGAATGAARGLGNAAAPLAGAVSRGLVGGTGETAAMLTREGLAHLPHAGAALGASELYEHLSESPHPVPSAIRGGARIVAQNIPGLPQNAEHRWRVQNGQ